MVLKILFEPIWQQDRKRSRFYPKGLLLTILTLKFGWYEPKITLDALIRINIFLELIVIFIGLLRLELGWLELLK